MTRHKNLKGKLLKVYDILENTFICICIETYYDFRASQYTHIVLLPNSKVVKVNTLEYYYTYEILS